MSVDPLAEDYYETSPYVYCLNNPVNAVDPDGRGVDDINPLKEVTVTAKKNNPVGSRAMDPVSGFWGWTEYLVFGRTYRSGENSNGKFPVFKATWNVNSDGIITGVVPLMGMPPIPTFAGGSIFIKGLNYVDKLKFHRVFKPKILKEAKKMLDFTRIVGKNPDIVIESGEIILKGTGEFSKQSFSTGLKAIDFFK